MNHEEWLAALAAELRRHGVSQDLGAHVLAEAAAHLSDSGQPPVAVFGRPTNTPRRWPKAWAHPIGGRPADLPALYCWTCGASANATDGRRRVLDGVDLSVCAGQVAAVVGANGCGKSTFLRICAGLASPDRGAGGMRARRSWSSPTCSTSSTGWTSCSI